MGNQESSTSEEEVALQDERKEQEAEHGEHNGYETRSVANSQKKLEHMSYDDIFMEETENDLDDIEDEDVDQSNVFPSSASSISHIPHFPSRLMVMIAYVQSEAKLIVKMEGTTDVPGRGQGGYGAYQMHLKLIAGETEEISSRMQVGPNPAFDEKLEMKIVRMQLPKAILECQLYGCRDGERKALCGEGTLALSEINPRIQNRMTIRLHPSISTSSYYSARSVDHETIVYDEDSDGTQAEVETIASHTVSRRPTTPAANSPQISRVQFSAEQKADQPTILHHRALPAELLLNASYSLVTGKFECIIQKAHGFHRPDGSHRPPSTLVHLEFRDNEGKLISEGVTKLVKGTSNPSFQEVFMFNVGSEMIHSVCLKLTVYHKPKTGKKVRLGVVIMGAENTSQTEEEHWNEIIDAHGRRVARWHSLYLIG